MDWLTQIKNAQKSCMVQGNLKKVHFDFGNGKAMVEEYNIHTNVVSRRAWKIQRRMIAQGEWDIEVGDPKPNFQKEQNLLIKENANEVLVFYTTDILSRLFLEERRNTRTSLEWRIRNLPYPLETYCVIADSQESRLVVKTTNKKYYKILKIPEFARWRIQPKREAVQIAHRLNTLIINYKKPQELLQYEKEVVQEIKNIKPTNGGSVQDYNLM